MISIDEAKSAGLVQKLLPKDGFHEAVRDYAKSLAPPKGAGLAVGLIKRSIQGGADLGLNDGLSLERELQQRLFQSEDAKEGMSANREGRKPEFRGH